MRAISIISLCLAVGACGGGATESAPSHGKATAGKPPAPKPRCRPDVDSEPADARARMSELEVALRKCFALGTAGKYGVSTLELEIIVAESGKVKSANVKAQDAQPAAAECAKVAARKEHFAKFCGADADIHWTYTLQ